MTSAFAWTDPVPHFSRQELEDPSGALVLDSRFAIALPYLRLQVGHPMRLTSCCRTRERNLQVGGHPRSLHVCDRPYRTLALGCMACDVSTWGWSSDKRDRFCSMAAELGWSVGVASIFVHLDRRVDIGLPRADFEY